MSKKFATPLFVEIHPSKRLLFSIIVLHIGAILICSFSNVPVLVYVLLVLLLGLQGYISLYLTGWISGVGFLKSCWPRIKSVKWSEANQWSLQFERGKAMQSELLPATFLHSALVVLNFRVANAKWYARRRFVVLFPADVGQTIHRRLRVVLRFHPFVQSSLWAWKN